MTWAWVCGYWDRVIVFVLDGVYIGRMGQQHLPPNRLLVHGNLLHDQNVDGESEQSEFLAPCCECIIV